MPATMSEQLFALRRSLAAIERVSVRTAHPSSAVLRLDQGAIDAAINGGLAQAALHEVLGERYADAAAARGFAAALALRSAGVARTIVWTLEANAAREVGSLAADGMSDFGFDPSRVLLIKARDATGALRVAVEAAQCRPLGAVVVEIWGMPKALDLNATRRLMLAAQRSGVMVVLARLGIRPQASAAETRWSVRALPSSALAANAPGTPAFSLSLLRHRHGIPGGPWRVEWNADDRLFNHQDPALPRDRLPALLDRPAAANAAGKILSLAG